MRFDGSNDSMATASYSANNATSGLLVMQSSQNAVVVILERSNNYNNNPYGYLLAPQSDTTLRWGTRTSAAANDQATANFTTRSTSWCVVQFNYNGSDASFTLFSNGTALSKSYVLAQNHATGTLNAPTFVGARNDAQFFYNGDMGALMTIPSDVGDPMRKRISHHAAYSFKIACN
jgi:hypothetical protein